MRRGPGFDCPPQHERSFAGATSVENGDSIEMIELRIAAQAGGERDKAGEGFACPPLAHQFSGVPNNGDVRGVGLRTDGGKRCFLRLLRRDSCASLPLPIDRGEVLLHGVAHIGGKILSIPNESDFASGSR
jgi:hypothetical protein